MTARSPLTPAGSPSPPARSLLVGAGGQVGAQLLRLLGPSRSLPTSRNPPGPAWLTLDLASLAYLSEAADLLDPHPLDAIYCIAGMTDVEACEGQADLAHRINARGPAVLAAYAHRRHLPFVYISTEYLFDGHAGPYTEDDPPHPISAYGRSKLAGEQAVLEAHPTALNLRTTVVYGPDDRRKNYLYSLLSSVVAGRPMRVPQDQISTPTYSLDLVRTAVGLVEANASGTFHVCGPELLSRLAFAQEILRYFHLDDRLLHPLPTAELGQRAPRPLSAGLDTGKLRRLYPHLRMRPLRESLADCEPQLRAHLLEQQSLTRIGDQTSWPTPGR